MSSGTAAKWAEENSRSFLSCGHVLEVRDIDVAGRGEAGVTIKGEAVLLQWRHRSRISPTMNFSMTVREGQAAGLPMVRGWKIIELVHCRIVRVITGHNGIKISPIDCILTLIDEHKHLGGAGLDSYFGVLFINCPGGISLQETALETTQIDVHGYAADSRHSGSSIGPIGGYDAAGVGRTFEDTWVLGTVGPHRASDDVLIDIPVGMIPRNKIEIAAHPYVPLRVVIG